MLPGHSAFFLNNAGATATAKKRARDSLNRALNEAIEPVYCTACGHLLARGVCGEHCGILHQIHGSVANVRLVRGKANKGATVSATLFERDMPDLVLFSNSVHAAVHLNAGEMKATPKCLKCRLLAVTTVKPCTAAVAAIAASSKPGAAPAAIARSSMRPVSSAALEASGSVLDR